MDSLKEIAAKRAAPGVLILDLEDRLLYSNRDAIDLLGPLQEREGEVSVPGEVYDLCRQLRNGAPTAVGVIRLSGGNGRGESFCSLRGLLLGDHRNGNGHSHVMVLLEKIIRNRQIDVEKARQKYGLSKREAEVVRLICQGLGNREISEVIFISEFTVKDHIKNIMRKMGVGSRNEIVAAIL